MIKNKMRILIPLLLSSSLLISGCNQNSDSATVNQEEIISNLVSYKDSDYYTSWQDNPFTSIKLEGQTATVDGENGAAIVENNQISIRTSGTYVITGTLDDGQIVVDSEDQGNVRLVLNGATINSSTSAPIYIKQADKTIISLEENSENTLSDAAEYVYENSSTDEPSATIYSKDDLTINGAGSLVVNGNYNDAIKSNDDLKITGGAIKVTSSDDGIVGRDLLAIKDATIDVDAGGDGLKASNDEDETKGNIVLESGNYTVVADGDGIQAEKALAVADGKYSITAGGGSPETITNAESGMGGGMGQGTPPTFNSGDIESFVDTLVEGIDLSNELKEKLKAAESMEDIQTILQDNPDILKQIQENGNMRVPGMQPGNGTPPEGMTDQSQNMNGQPAPPSNGTDNTDGGTSGPPAPPTSDGQFPQGNANESSGEQNAQTTEDDTISTKGVKAGTALYVIGGTINVDSLEDAIHSNQDVTISGGTINLSTGDDGIHGDADVLLNGGNVTIDKSLEGIEGINITVAAGTYHVVAEDDGININGGGDEFGMPGGFGNMTPQGTTDTTATQNKQEAADSTESKNQEEASDEGLLLIKGGYLFVNANGDGLDSNASIKMTGGTAIVYGPTNNGNAPLDYNNTFDIEGGILVASGSSGMAQGISDSSSQHAIMMTYSETQEAQTAVYVTDENGETVLAIAPDKPFQSIVISTPDLEADKTYKFLSGGNLTGENIDGYYENPNYEAGSLTLEFPISNVMTYLNNDGVTEGNSNGMMNGNPFGGDRQQGRMNPFGTEENSEQSSQNGGE